MRKNRRCCPAHSFETHAHAREAGTTYGNNQAAERAARRLRYRGAYRRLTRARSFPLALGPAVRHIPEPMAGSPLKRARKQGVRLDDGSIVAFPYMPRVADLPPGWRHFTTAQKIEHLIGLDRCEEILSWGPITELDPLRLSFQVQVIRVLLKIAVKAYLNFDPRICTGP